jgi:transcription-repair coupling factor (superfamily II helicase)
MHMSLIGVRDMSILEEAPAERLPIQTYIMEESDDVVRDAIRRELRRGGQVFYVYNRVGGIEEAAARIGAIVPEAEVAYAHGQMGERALEKVMYSFVNGEIDVLISTTIIETGLDIMNANTLIIHDADKFGLSQLYQLRGRVGRSNRTAYAFLLFRRDKVLSDIARKRLSAIREFTQLGSGYRIAMRDLQIRGAGSLLGEYQSGNIGEVGYDLYCKLLGEAVAREKGEPVRASAETVMDMDVDAYLPASYIRSENQKLDMYKRIASVQNEEEYEDVVEELLDRFGEIPSPAMNLLKIVRLKTECAGLDAELVSLKNGILQITLSFRADINADGIPDLLRLGGGKLKLKFSGKSPVFEMNLKKLSADKSLKQAEELVKTMRMTLLKNGTDGGK